MLESSSEIEYGMHGASESVKHVEYSKFASICSGTHVKIFPLVRRSLTSNPAISASRA